MPGMNVNGCNVNDDADADTPLLWVLREQLGLTSTKYGYGVAQCGSCTVHSDYAPVRSCVMPASAVSATQNMLTIEALSKNGDHPLQKAWVAHDVAQCGHCQKGMVMAAVPYSMTNPRQLGPTSPRPSPTSAVAAPTAA